MLKSVPDMPDSKIRVAYILTPITFGGSEKVSLNFLKTVDRSRFDISPILLTRPWEDEPYFANEIRDLGYAYNTVPVSLKSGGDPLRVLRVVSLLYSIMRQEGFSLVHTHGYFADICALPMAYLLGIPRISTCHGFIVNDRKLKTYNLLDKYVLRLSNKVFSVSEGIRDELIKSGIKETNIVVVPNAVSAPCEAEDKRVFRLEKRSSLGISPHDFVVGYIGRLSEEKGVLYLIEAISKLHDASKPVKLLLVGEGPERAALEQQVIYGGLEKSVIFTGFQTDAESWLPAFDTFILPSLTEGTPMALLEAMAAGVPVIASAVGGIPQVVTDGINGLLVPPGSIECLTNTIKLLISNHELVDQITTEGTNTIKTKYSISNWTQKIENQYIICMNQECLEDKIL